MVLFSQFPFGGGASVALAPVDLASGAQTSLWANVRDINDFLWLYWYFGAGAAAEHATLTLQQAKTAAGGSAKALSVREVWFKRGSAAFTPGNASVTDLWTKSALATREAPIASYATATDRISAVNHFVAAIRVSKSDVDGANGFSYVGASCNDVGVAVQLGFALWIPEGFAYLNSPISLLT
jgi:hypothetical protein